ncbi:MAG: PEP-CTERM sorting domain-containing protein [Verrucomicrobiaceae bacterium]|nr:MAG: PEP-CTERM sorting domain-containing protein [Verrucomicrobiaceae bacterium]
MKPLSSLLALWLLQPGSAQAATYIPVGSSSTLWTPMISINGYDFHTDQQTGQAEADIVGGTGTNYGFLVTFHDNGTVSSTDGTLAFRVRLDKADGNKNDPEYSGLVWVGVDADTDGDLDVFLGANMQGNAATNAVEIRAPGTGLNISPNTTTISGTAYKTYALDRIEDATPANYNYRAVDQLIDGGINDVTQTTTGDPDYYLSFMVPFADIVQYLGSLSAPINITENTQLRFVVATAKQANSLNQDIGGVAGGVNSSVTWEDLGGFTPPYTPVPEPSSTLLLLGSLAGGCFIRRRC